jgi:hypothetical protein
VDNDFQISGHADFKVHPERDQFASDESEEAKKNREVTSPPGSNPRF